MNIIKKILIISGGCIDDKWFDEWLKCHKYDYCIAADKGIETADKHGISVNLLLGDYDSANQNIVKKYKNNVETITYPAEKDYTDTHLAIKKAYEILQNSDEDKIAENEKIMDIVGASGTRLDHTMTNIFILDEYVNSGVQCYIYDKNNKIYIKDKDYVIKKSEQYGNYISFLPLSEHAKLTLKGFKYPLEHYEIKQGQSICQSNEIISNDAFVRIESGKVITFESKD